MADSKLILHVKGTESETTVVPKHEVRAAISQGKITQSQLIWIPTANSWKQVKELPELLESQRLILHVKGTEGQTQELPKQQVKAAISEGKMTRSQLIWIPGESTWKPVRELPDLLPGETHILHVKGTESETKELPRKAIKTALTKGEITHSQLIWSANDQAWKQVRDIPELLPSQKLAPAPTREQMQAMPRIADGVDGVIPESPSGPVARAVEASGDIPRVRVASSEPVVAKPQVHVAGSPPKVIPKVSAMATPRVAAVQPEDAQASVAAVPVAVPAVVPVATAAASVPQVRVAAASTATPARVKAATVPVAQAREPVDHRIADHSGSHPMKWLCIGLGALIFVIIVANYLLVDQPLAGNLAKTKYSDITVYGHLGAFMQPSVMVIHIRPNSTLTGDTLPDFLAALAHSTPTSPLTGEPYMRVAITSGWTAQYSFSGYSWKELGDMATATEEQRKADIMSRMADAGGSPILPESTLNEEAQEAQRQIIWAAFVSHFTAK